MPRSRFPLRFIPVTRARTRKHDLVLPYSRSGLAVLLEVEFTVLQAPVVYDSSDRMNDVLRHHSARKVRPHLTLFDVIEGGSGKSSRLPLFGRFPEEACGPPGRSWRAPPCSPQGAAAR